LCDKEALRSATNIFLFRNRNQVSEMPEFE